MEVECMCSSAHKQRGVLMMTVWRCKKITIILHKFISTNVNKKEKWQCVKMVISTL